MNTCLFALERTCDFNQVSHFNPFGVHLGVGLYVGLQIHETSLHKELHGTNSLLDPRSQLTRAHFHVNQVESEQVIRSPPCGCHPRWLIREKMRHKTSTLSVT